MQSASASLATAITSVLRTPTKRVQVDWDRDGSYGDTYDDLTPVVQSVTVDRQVATDIDAGAPTGLAAAEATIQVAGDFPDGALAATVLSAYSGGMPGVTRMGAPVDIDLGMVGSAGKEYVDAFYGQLRDVSIDAAERTAAITCLDREGLRGAVLLPAVVAEEPGASPVKPGLSSAFLVDWVLRQCNVYASPPPRANAVLSATMYGSAFPEVGQAAAIFTAYWQTTAGRAGPCLFVTSPSGHPALGNAEVGGGATTRDNNVVYDLDPMLANSGQSTFVEGFWTFVIGASQAIYQVYDSALLFGASLTINATRTQLTLEARRNGTGASTVISIPALALDTEHYIAFAIDWALTQASWVVRVNGTSYTGAALALPNASSGDPLRLFLQGPGVASGHMVRGVQVATEPAASPTWNDGFTETPTTRDPSLSQMIATPNVSEREPWVLLQMLAKAEGGVAMLDETGRFVFRNRNHMTGGTSVMTVTSATNLKRVAASEAIDTVRNVIRVGAVPLTFDATTTTIWSATEIIMVPASSAITVPVQFPGRVYFYTAYSVLASRSSDGTGGDASVSVSVSIPNGSDRGEITVTNGNAFDVFLVDNSTAPSTQGSPHLSLSGSCIRDIDTGGYMAEARDTTSVTVYGEQPLEVPPNPFLQSWLGAQTYAQDLLTLYKDPRPVLTGVEIVADPRLQLTDRVTITEPGILGLSTDFWVLGISTTLASDGLSQSLTVRQA